jgi:ribose transport system substrate-binding protein
MFKSMLTERVPFRISAFPGTNTMKRLIMLCLLVILFGCGSSDSKSDKMRIAVIPKGTTHVFWQFVHAGAVKAAEELDVDLLWVGPEKEDDRQQQIALVDNQVINDVSGIVLAPLDEEALRRPVQAAANHGVPVVIFDSALKDADAFTVSLVATDNLAGGRLAGRNLAEKLNGQGKVVMLGYSEGSASTEKREQGFLESISKFPEIEVVSDEQYGGATTALALQASENLLLRYKGDNNALTIDGIFCPNESTTFGMLQALRRNQLAGKVVFVGFDSSEPLLEGIHSGEIDGLVVQNPFKMGYLGVKTMYNHLQGQSVEKFIDTGVAFVSQANIEQPEIIDLVSPDLKKWLEKK